MSDFSPSALDARAGQARWVLRLAFLVLAGAFFNTQILEHERYRLRSEDNRLRAVPLTPARGPILDRFGRIIAENVPGYSVKLLAPNADSLRQALDRLGQIVPVDSAGRAEAMRRFRAEPYLPALVIRDATTEQVARLEERRVLLPGLVIQAEPKRLYPAGSAVAHVVGYVAEVTEGDLAANRYQGAQIGALVGKAGLELEYDRLLRGTPGMRYIEVNARGRLVREDGAAPPRPPETGAAVRTTIDLDLQRFVDSIWPAGVRGALVAMTPDGQVLALYSSPTYDPNLFIGGISSEQWRALRDDPANPLYNRAIQGRYPPASPFKLAVAAMALRRGLVTFGTHMPEPCTGSFKYGNRVFRCWDPRGHGSLDLTGAIAQSCDVYFYQLGLKIGLENLLADGQAMGFRGRSGVDLEGEMMSIIPPDVAYFDRRYGPRGWSRGVVLNLSIGQGEIDQTVMNMTRYYLSLANPAGAPEPYLVAPRAGTVRKADLTEAQLEGMRRALIAVVERGTAQGTRSADLLVGGKTGTGQNPHGKDHGWFIGFAPADKPEIVVGAIMEFAEHGTNVAPYVVKAIRRWYFGSGANANDRVRLLTPDDSPRAPSAPDDTLLPGVAGQ
ncbi:MAG TPA: penicillin-binding protein 2 [Gemmatimonadales bacterium]|nr:penicillin-binding protein 2 [Gemmatimonadales bacterium]